MYKYEIQFFPLHLVILKVLHMQLRFNLVCKIVSPPPELEIEPHCLASEGRNEPEI